MVGQRSHLDHLLRGLSAALDEMLLARGHGQVLDELLGEHAVNAREEVVQHLEGRECLQSASYGACEETGEA